MKRSSRQAVVGLGFFFVSLQVYKDFSSLLDSTRERSLREQQEGTANGPISLDGEHLRNLMRIKAWRAKYADLCVDENANQEDLLAMLESLFKPLNTTVDTPTPRLERCNHVFLDFGANVGDSLGKFIDSGIRQCPAKQIDKHPRLDLSAMKYGRESFHGRENVLVRSTRNILDEMKTFPEEYCYYGVEGNPRFTKHLKTIQDRIMYQTHPRPVHRAHFLTETVAAGSDGPTVLYLDSINEERNFWGSSILVGHQDVIRSAKAGNGLQKAQVLGITLSTLIHRTVNKVRGAHVLIKMDIEGGEYAVLEEALQTGTVCDYARAGVKIHLLLETHRPDVIGEDHFDLQHWRHVLQSLNECGIVLKKGRDAGR